MRYDTPMRELSLPAPLVLLPGLGADARQFTPQQKAFGPSVHTPDRIAAHDNEGLASHAKRWAEKINAELLSGFDKDTPWFLGGTSMGGMIALEMLPFLDPQPAALFLIASSRSAPAYPAWAKIGAEALLKLSEKMIACTARAMAIPYGVRDGLDDDGYRLLKVMLDDCEPDYIKWALGATIEWSYAGTPAGYTAPPIYQIHGRRDWLIQPPQHPVDELIDNGRHLLNLSHAHTINRWLFDHILSACGIDESNEPRVEDPDQTLARRPDMAARF